MAEYFDDLDVSQKIMKAVFNVDEDDKKTGEKLGEERLGSSSLIKNFGLT